ncbi:hypothetical protein FGIG_03490 [Fasciola gigantica]|uniref:Uncharacterized protein n=1 Tax=Fasciola gigantica TaxID=46835 RepID=A0A504YYT7_FASGI|nr:hypothetical protein FGIG_03490 [Fasciola gigantica]
MLGRGGGGKQDIFWCFIDLPNKAHFCRSHKNTVKVAPNGLRVKGGRDNGKHEKPPVFIDVDNLVKLYRTVPNSRINDKERDRTSVVEKSVSTFVRQLKQSVIINSSKSGRIPSVETRVLRLYGLPNVGRPAAPPSPILDMSNSPYDT